MSQLQDNVSFSRSLLCVWHFFLLSKAKGTLGLVSREKAKVEPMLREKLISMPWLVSVWQKSKHLMAKGELASSTAVILVYF